MAAPKFIDALQPMEIRNGNLHMEDGNLSYCIPLSVVRAGHRRIGAMLAMHDTEADNVVPLPKQRQPKH